jgi:hypothetical protein
VGQGKGRRERGLTEGWREGGMGRGPQESWQTAAPAHASKLPAETALAKKTRNHHKDKSFCFDYPCYQIFNFSKGN